MVSVSGVANVKVIQSEPVSPGWDWSETLLPWAYESTDEFTVDWPSGVNIVDIQTGSSDFFTNLQNTVNAAGGRCVVRLGVGVYTLNQFRMIGSSGDPDYAVGFWFPNLQGLLGQGADKTFVQMNANSMSSAQLAKLGTMISADFAPTQLGVCRFDGSTASPVLVAGLTFRSADQQMLTTKGADIPAVIPQPAPHNGVQFYGNSKGIVSHVRFQAAGRAMTSSPPFETANAQTGRSDFVWRNCEFDGRRSPDLDPARPRRCGPVMVNGETRSEFIDCWFHHSNVSRYAANDQSRDFQGEYIVTRCKAEQITNTHNTDPNLNGGVSLGGYTNATPFGWESTNGTITLTDCIVSQDNPYTDGQKPCHLQVTHVGPRNPRGGRMFTSAGCEWRNTAHSWLDGYLLMRIHDTTWWWTDGFNTTIDARNSSGQRLAPYVVTSSWPPSASSLSSAGVTPQTHYLINRT